MKKIIFSLLFIIGCSGGYKQQPVVQEVPSLKNYQPLYCGIGKVALTPYKNTSMAGYAPGNRIATGTFYDQEREFYHHLYSRAVILHNKTEVMPGKKYIAYVSVDILILTDALTDKVKQLISDDIAIVLCATHPHSSIGGYWCCTLPSIAMGSFDEENLQYLAEKIAQSIGMAKKSIQPAKLGCSYGIVDNTTKNRRRKQDPVDTRMTLIHIENENDEAMADLVWFAGHPIIMPSNLWKFSSDFPGAFTRILEKETDSYVALFFQGGLGDVTTRPPKELWAHKKDRIERRVERVEAVGSILAKKVKELRHNLELSSVVDLHHYSPRFLLGTVNVNAIPDFLIPLEIVARVWIDWGYMPKESHLGITSIDNKLQKISIANFPFEISSTLAIDLRSKLERHYDVGIVTSLANGWYSYLMHSYSAMWPPSGPEYLESFFDPGYAESVMDYAYSVAAKVYSKKKIRDSEK